MPITAIRRDLAYPPGIVRIMTTDTLATVSATGYLFAQGAVIWEINSGPFQWSESDMVLVFASDGWEFFTISADFESLDLFAVAGGGTVDPGLINELAWYSATGNVVSGLPTANNSVLVTSAGGVPSLSDTLPTNTLIGTPDGLDQDEIINIRYYNTAQAILELLTQVNSFNYSLDTGAADAYVATLTPTPGGLFPALSDGLTVILSDVSATNLTDTPTLDVNGLGAKDIVLPSGDPVPAGTMIAGQSYTFLYSAANDNFQISDGQDSWVTPDQVQINTFNYGVDSGISTAYAVALSPVVTSYTGGLSVFMLAANTNTTTTPTLDVNGVGPSTIKLPGGGPLVVGSIVADNVYLLLWNPTGACWELSNPSTTIITSTEIQENVFNYSLDTGADGTSYVATLSPVVTSYVPGLSVILTSIHTNSSTTPTLDVNGVGASTIKLSGGGALVLGSIVTGTVYEFLWNAGDSSWELVNPTITTITSLQVQDNAFNYSLDTGSSGTNYVATLSPVVTSYVAGLSVLLGAINTNSTTTPTLNVNGVGASTIKLSGGSPLVVGSIVTGNVYEFLWNAADSSWELVNPSITSITALQIQDSAFTYSADTGSDGTNYAATLSPAIVGYVDGLTVLLKAANTNTIAAPTLNVNGVGASTIALTDGSALPIGSLVANTNYLFLYNGTSTKWELVNPSIVPVSNVQTDYITNFMFMGG